MVDKKRTCKIIDSAVPGDSKIEKEKEKIDKDQDLRRELQKIWDVRVNVVASLGAIPRQFGNRLKEDWCHNRNRAISEDSFIRNS